MTRAALAAVGLLLALVSVGCSTSTKCVVAGKSHAVGESFPSADGCNTCSCGADGTVSCTLIDCTGAAGTSGQAGTSGAAGSTGAAGTKGAAGTSGQAGTSGSAGSGGQACAFATGYTFRDDGGLRAGFDESSLAPARTHTIERTSFGVDAGKLSCARSVPCTSPSAVTVSAVEAAVGQADVQAALAKAPGMVYGTDPRPVDGTVWLFQRADGKNFYVGGGNTVPAGLRALQTLLRKLEDETLLAPECAALRAR